jgi:uncharacterized membrane protein YeaQ/YmgE (transglycosylase-associated protein family)
MGVLSWLVVGLVAGWLTGKIMGGPGKGPLMDIIVGLLGALSGGVVVSVLGMRSSGGLVYTIIVAVFGAVILTWAYRKLAARTPAGAGK